ncbi:hypothetical protein [Kitasatospora sp. NBC_01300]|uniref:hypothetical protein n=1 Tax=Kitasatospora sp. NBC_01300 TaxID=2903574 RepID=UPI00352FB462|nr:hypothetical protein OG556_27955 [Kitasatospora sp. NBC_01300]
MAETTAVPGGPEPAADSGPWDAVPPPRTPAEEHPPGPAALYEPPPVPPLPPSAPAAPPSAPTAPATVPGPPPTAPTGWTVTGMPAVGAPPSAATPLPFPAPGVNAPGTGGLGAAPRGRILVVEGGYGNSGRRTWGRGGPAQASVLSAMLAAVSPQVLLAADAVDAVHLPGASDPHTVLAHLRAASRHPGPLLVHLGGHVVADKRGGQLQLTLRDSKQDGLPWQAVAAELSHRPAEWQTLVVADLSADQNAWPYLQGAASPLSEGIPLWAVVSPDPEQVGTFTRALIEALHGGRPGAGDVLAPEQLRQQVYSVLRPDVVILATHAPDRPVFRNTARRGDGPPADVSAPVDAVPPVDAVSADGVPVDAVRADVVPSGQPAVSVAPVPGRAESQDAVVEPPVAPTAPRPSASPAPAAEAGPVSLVKPGVPPTPPRPARPVSLLKGQPAGPAGVTLHKPAPADATPEAVEPSAGVTLAKPQQPASEPELESEREREPEPEQAPADAVSAQAPPVDEAPTDAAPTAETPDGTAPTDDAAPVDAVPVAEAPADAVPADEVPADAVPVDAPVSGQPRADYREAIGRIVRSADAGEHDAATELAFALELEAIAEHGAVSEPVLQVRQVRAHVCRLAGRPAEAADIYREVALALLRSQGSDHPETQQAATNAEACWRSVPDRAVALRIAPEIIELRAYLPGPDGRKLRAAERYLAQLAAAPEPAATPASAPADRV